MSRPFRFKYPKYQNLLREARLKLNKTIEDVSQALGYPGYTECETLGTFPPDEKMQKALCDYLRLDLEEVKMSRKRGPGRPNAGEPADLLPIIKILAKTKLKKVEYRDLEFLEKFVRQMRMTLTPPIAESIVRQRQAEEI